MNAEPVVIAGTVRADGTLELEGKIPLPAGKVSVTLLPVAQPLAAAGFLAALREIQNLRESFGVKADADAALAAAQRVRDEFDEQVEEMSRLQEQCRRERLAAEAAQKEVG